MTEDEVLAEFRAAGALMEGHFILSSGLRSPVFLQKMRIFEDPVRAGRLCRALGEAITARFGPVRNHQRSASAENLRAYSASTSGVSRSGSTEMLTSWTGVPASWS